MWQKKQSLLLILALFLTVPVLGQTSLDDSVRNVLRNTAQDTAKVNFLNQLSAGIWQSEPQQAIKYGNEALKFAKSANYTEGVALANKNIGLGYYMQAEYVNVLVHWEASLKAYQELKDKNGVANLLGNIGAIHFNGGDNAMALEYYLRALKVAEEINDISRIATLLSNIGGVYNDKANTKYEAANYFQRALKYANITEDKDIIGFITSNLTEIFLDRKQYDSALYYADLSLEAFRGTSTYAMPLSLKGEVFKDKGDYRMAILLQTEAVDHARSFDQDLEMGQALLRLGDTYVVDNKPYAALKSYGEALKVAKKIEANYQIKDAYEGLAKTHEQLGEFEQAYQYSSKLSQMKDTIFNAETEETMRSLQFTYDLEKKEDEINILEKTNQIQQIDNQRQEAISWAAGIIGFLIFLGLIGLFHRYRFIKKIKSMIEREKDRSDELLLNILPEETAEELKEKGEAEAKNYDSVSILFTDFKGFTQISTMMSPRELVKEIHECFKMFDIIMTRHGVEKIKTIGDAYMAAGGLPISNDTHAIDVARAGLDIREYMDKLKVKRQQEDRPCFEVRIGIHTGPVVAGIVGIKKFAYDIWGDSVNVASRMESNSEAGKVNISETTYSLIKDQFKCTYRGEIEAKNRGLLKMYFLDDEIGKEGNRLEEQPFETEKLSKKDWLTVESKESL